MGQAKSNLFFSNSRSAAAGTSPSSSRANNKLQRRKRQRVEYVAEHLRRIALDELEQLLYSCRRPYIAGTSRIDLIVPADTSLPRSDEFMIGITLNEIQDYINLELQKIDSLKQQHHPPPDPLPHFRRSVETAKSERSTRRKLLPDESQPRRTASLSSHIRIISAADVPTWQQYVRQHGLRLDASLASTYMQHDECLHEKIGIFVGDIVRLQVDGIVNAANRNLEPGVAAKSNLNDHHIAGSGVCGAIHRAAGPRLSIDCRALAPCETGHAVATYAYKLPSKMVIHTVGPEYEDRQMLSACYTNSLDVAVYYEMKTIAFPCIATGTYGYPHEKAADVAIGAVRSWLETSNSADRIDRIIFCLFNTDDIKHYERLLFRYFPIYRQQQRQVINTNSSLNQSSSLHSIV